MSVIDKKEMQAEMLAAYLLHIHDEGYASDYNSDEWWEWNESDGDYTSEEEEEEEDEGIVEDSEGFSSYYYNSDEDQWFYPNDEEEEEDGDLL